MTSLRKPGGGADSAREIFSQELYFECFMRLCRHVQIFVAIMHVNRDITKMLESQIEVFLFVFFLLPVWKVRFRTTRWL